MLKRPTYTRLHPGILFSLLLFIIVLLPLTIQGQATTAEDLKGSWEQILPDEAGHLILTDRNGKLLFEITRGKELQSGSWSVKADTLNLVFDLMPQQSAIDSMVFEVKDKSPEIHFYSDSSNIISLGENGLKTGHHTETYLFELKDRSHLFLATIDGHQQWEYEMKQIDDDWQISFNDIARGVFGLIVLVMVCYLVSRKKRFIDWRLVITGILLQIAFAILVLQVGFVKEAFSAIAWFFVKVLDFSYEGALFLFGDLVSRTDTFGFIFAFQVLPTIVFFSALTSFLYYLGILQKIVFGFAWVMNRTMHLSGAESLAAAANIFIGQTEAPLVVKPYLEKMTKSEMLCLMVGGMATIAGGVFAAYIGFLGGDDPTMRHFFATHLLTASILSAPAAIVCAKILYPEEDKAMIERKIEVPREKIGSNILDAISNGTTDGLKLAINVGAMLLTFTALIYMVNYILIQIGGLIGINEQIIASTDGRFDGFSLDYILGLLFSPVSWVIGAPWKDAMVLGELLGKKTIINEFVAYEKMNEVVAAGGFHAKKSIIIATYALCGFANFASIGIQIGGIGVLAPNQRKTLARFGILALLGGTVAALMTSVIAGIII